MGAKTVAEWRKTLILSYGRFGITIKGVKTDVTTLDIPEAIGNQQVVAIGAYAFQQCTSLLSITLPNTIKKIDCSAFLGCTNLASVVIGNECADIADDAFRGCPKLADDQGYVVVNGMLYGYYGADVGIKIPPTVTEISATAFASCNTIKSIVLPQGLTYIPIYAFAWCKELEKIYIPATVIRIADKAFNHCKKLIIETPAGSFAEQYAIANNISIKTI